jgi:hypothetical protein
MTLGDALTNGRSSSDSDGPAAPLLRAQVLLHRNRLALFVALLAAGAAVDVPELAEAAIESPAPSPIASAFNLLDRIGDAVGSIVRALEAKLGLQPLEWR